MPAPKIQLKLRLATIEDAEQISLLTAQLGYAADVGEIKSRLNVILKNPGNAVFVAVNAAGAVVGSIHAFLVQLIESPFRAEIGGLVVDAQHQRQGIGKALADAVQTWAEAAGAKELSVRCNLNRPEAHRFYEAQGFKNVKSQKVFRKPL